MHDHVPFWVKPSSLANFLANQYFQYHPPNLYNMQQYFLTSTTNNRIPIILLTILK